MKILALDTATENCSAALFINGRVSAREQLRARGHAEHILSMIDELLAESGQSLRGLDAIAFGRGPGAFTGVRLAASVTQGLAFGAGVPVVPVSDLLAVAQRALDAEPAMNRVLVCSDARMQEVYWGCYERAATGLAVGAGEEHVGRPEAVHLPPAWEVAAGSHPGAAPALVQAVGSGFAAYPQLRLAFSSRVSGIRDAFLPRAREIAQLAAAEVTAGRVLGADGAIPVYLRDDVAQPPRNAP